MPAKSRLFFAIAACLLLSNCGLIGTALRLAPYAVLLADQDGTGTPERKALEKREREVQNKGRRGIMPAVGSTGSQVAFTH